MFEELIVELDSMGLPYTEDYEMGVMNIDITNASKIDVIDVITTIDSYGMEYTIDATNITVQSGTPVEAEPVEESETDYQGMALEDMLG